MLSQERLQVVEDDVRFGGDGDTERAVGVYECADVAAPTGKLACTEGRMNDGVEGFEGVDEA